LKGHEIIHICEKLSKGSERQNLLINMYGFTLEKSHIPVAFAIENSDYNKS
jgi:hypothetical protein